MTPTATADRIEITDPAAMESGPAAAVTGALEAGLLAAVRAARPGATATLATLNLELTGAAPPGASLRVVAWVERATRTLAFASADVLAGDRRIATGGGVFELGLRRNPSATTGVSD